MSDLETYDPLAMIRLQLDKLVATQAQLIRAHHRIAALEAALREISETVPNSNARRIATAALKAQP